MKRLFALGILLLVFSTPALAQTATTSPAAYLPSDVPAYLEVRMDSSGQTALNQLAALAFQLNGTADTQIDVIDTLVTSAFSSIFPGIDVRKDVLPWLGDSIAIALSNGDSGDLRVKPARPAHSR